MYHDTIHIKFRYWRLDDIEFDYSFLISKTSQKQFSPINYGSLLDKFNEIGFNIKYLKFNDLDLNSDIYCTYNYQPNFNVFFSAYKKLIHKKDFNITYEYGNIINGVFVQNNMTTFSSVSFVSNVIDSYKKNKIYQDLLFKEIDIIRDKTFFRTIERYQIIDKDGNTIASEITDSDSNFQQNFFDKYKVVVALRKYKLNKIMQFED